MQCQDFIVTYNGNYVYSANQLSIIQETIYRMIDQTHDEKYVTCTNMKIIMSTNFFSKNYVWKALFYYIEKHITD